MILSDRQIEAALRRGQVRITPPPDDLASDVWSSTALDLRLDARLQVWLPDAPGARLVVDPCDLNFSATELASAHAAEADCSDGFEIEPGMFLLGWTIEKLQLPHASRIAARVEGKSSLARIGLGVHVTAPTIHAGFGFRAEDPGFVGNPIQLEIWNAGPLTVRLVKGLRICQVIFEEVSGVPSRGYDGVFAVQGPDVAPPG
ncbi:dCTP deaminase [Paludisphaera mucosa]|uniref:dCTP deaminase n=1 Tax=Paludisphaera mucosa TaxID=3030827 RepID=A0ABT6FCN6_9BACT|nr:dCTP deaminase [Paludisphaera mucosa]MDG3005158.1 dCTP deaminase [Paludisphaera mucosa]